MKNFLRTAVLTGIPFGAMMGLFWAHRGAAAAVVGGSVMGLAFGCAMAGFVALQYKRSAKLREPYEAEGIEHDGPATYRSSTAVGGWLILTKQRLVFVPHKLNVGDAKLEIPRDEIVAARPVSALLPNAIEIGTRSQQIHRFVVGQRATWLAKLPQLAR